MGRKRSTNQDRFGACPERGLYVVADGMGGHTAGCLAADLGVRTLLSRIPEGSPSRDPLREAIRSANAAVRGEAKRDRRRGGMGATLAVVWAGPDAAWVAHVGDSRVYLIRDGILYPLTRDHSVVSLLVSHGKISAAEARHHPRRNVVTRALGVSTTVEPDLCEVRVAPGDRFLLCTDGISGALSDAEIHRLVKEVATDLDRAVASLIDAANARGGRDNATVLIATVGRGASESWG